MTFIGDIQRPDGYVPPSPLGTKYVYVIGSCDGPKKIGISARPEDRLLAFRNISADPLKVIGVLTADVRSAGLIERYAHWLLSSEKLKGEWFNVTADRALDTLGMAAKAIEREEAPPPRWSNKGKVVLQTLVDESTRRKFAEIASSRNCRIQDVVDEVFADFLMSYELRR